MRNGTGIVAKEPIVSAGRIDEKAADCVILTIKVTRKSHLAVANGSPLDQCGRVCHQST